MTATMNFTLQIALLLTLISDLILHLKQTAKRKNKASSHNLQFKHHWPSQYRTYKILPGKEFFLSWEPLT